MKLKWFSLENLELLENLEHLEYLEYLKHLENPDLLELLESLAPQVKPLLSDYPQCTMRFSAQFIKKTLR
jgi:hypothetical protein